MVSIDGASILPEDGTAGTLVGRVWIPAEGGPSVVVVREGGVFDVMADFPTVSTLAEESDPAMALRKAKGKRIGDMESLARNTPPELAILTGPGSLHQSTCRC